MGTKATKNIKRRIFLHNLSYALDDGRVLSYDHYDEEWVISGKGNDCHLYVISSGEVTKLINTCPGRLV